MGGVVASIFGGGAGALTGGIASIINSIKGRNPEDAAKLQELMSKHQDLVVQTQADLERAQLEANVSLNQTAAGNIQTEAKANWYTASARPSIIYCWVGLMLYNYMVAGWIHRAPANFPDLFWEISGAAILGYVVTRTGQDIAKAALGGAGGSLNIFGMKADSKGDK